MGEPNRYAIEFSLKWSVSKGHSTENDQTNLRGTMVRWARGALLESVAIDRSVPRRLGLQICNGLRDLIVSGALKPGDRLPATRTLAKEFGVSRATIVESFDRLISEGILETRVGAGTYVAQTLPADPLPRTETHIDPPPAQIRPKELDSAGTATRFGERLVHEPRAFTTAMPALDVFPMAQWARLSAKHWRGRRDDILGYPDAIGYRPLRQAVAAHLRINRGILCDWRDVIITAGAQQAFHLIGTTLAAPGDRVWFEEPGAIGARNSLILAGLDPVPVPVDAHGIDVEAGLAAAPEFRLAFVTPAHQQPLGMKMSLERRLALLRAAGAAGAFVIEDDWDSEFAFSGRPVPPLRSLDTSGRVVYVGSFSKSLFPALRIGFLLAPGELAEHFRLSLDAAAPGVPTALQAILADFLDEGHFTTHVRRMRKLYADRHQILQTAAQQHLAPWLDLMPTDIGMHTVGWLKAPLDADRLTQHAARRGVTLAPVSRFALRPYPRQGVVLGFSGFTESQLIAGVQVLRDTFESLAILD